MTSQAITSVPPSLCTSRLLSDRNDGEEANSTLRGKQHSSLILYDVSLLLLPEWAILQYCLCKIKEGRNGDKGQGVTRHVNWPSSLWLASFSSISLMLCGAAISGHCTQSWFPLLRTTAALLQRLRGSKKIWVWGIEEYRQCKGHDRKGSHWRRYEGRQHKNCCTSTTDDKWDSLSD